LRHQYTIAYPTYTMLGGEPRFRPASIRRLSAIGGERATCWNLRNSPSRRNKSVYMFERPAVWIRRCLELSGFKRNKSSFRIVLGSVKRTRYAYHLLVLMLRIGLEKYI
jgi:hypothetical protein